MKLTMTKTAYAEMPVRDPEKRRALPKASANVKFDVEIPDGLPDEKVAAFYLALQRETERFAQASAVELRDREVNKMEAERIRALPKDRPSIIVQVGTKDPAAVQVVRGTYEVMGRKLTAPKREEGQ